ncbi:MAG: hypothetical protein WCV90_08335 [Candidatus Woesearchaeota archaeon]|jgi:hypothetical protein
MGSLSDSIVQIWGERSPEDILSPFCFRVDQSYVGLISKFEEKELWLDIYDSKSGQLTPNSMSVSYVHFFNGRFRSRSKKEVLSEIPRESALAERILLYLYA